ncbi:hypothetical protein SLOPH_599, partial [Spraguea lophii 42_110]
MLLLYIAIPIIIITINIYLYIRYKKNNKNKYTNILNTIKPHFNHNYTYFTAISQRIEVYKNKDNNVIDKNNKNVIDTLIMIISLKNDWCIFQYLLNPKESNIIIKIKLNIDYINFFYIKHKKKISYPQLKYLKKKIYKDGNIYSNINNTKISNSLIEFCNKYHYDRFYITNIPQSVKEVDSYPSIVYLSMSYKQFIENNQCFKNNDENSKNESRIGGEGKMTNEGNESRMDNNENNESKINNNKEDSNNDNENNNIITNNKTKSITNNTMINDIFNILNNLPIKPSEQIYKLNKETIKLYEKDVYTEIIQKREKKNEEKVLRDRQSRHIEEKKDKKK